MGGITCSRRVSACVGVALCVVAEGTVSTADELVQRERGASTSGPAIGSDDREAFDAYEGELQLMLAEARRAGPEPITASQASGRRAAGEPLGAISTSLAGTPPGTSSATPSSHPQRAALVAETSSSRAIPAAQSVAVTINVSGPSAAPSAQCRFFQPGAEQTTAGDCMSCHGMSQTHPVDLDYAAAAARRPGFYRPSDEVVRRGVFLPGGQIKCVTCHDLRSPWKDKIALPPGAAATPAVDLGRPETYERPRSRTAADAHLPPGSAVTPTPLCQSCHTYGD